MKNLTILFVAALSVVILSTQAFAAKFHTHAGVTYQITAGTVVSINKAKNLFAIKDSDDAKVYGFMARAADIAALNDGDHVVVTTELPGALATRITR